MSTLYKTLCCDHEYFGINHSPVLETGYCLHCGYHPKIDELKEQLKEALSIIEELRKSNEFYANFTNYSNLTEYGAIYRTAVFSDMEEINEFTKYGGKLARKTKRSTDERIEKLRKEVV